MSAKKTRIRWFAFSVVGLLVVILAIAGYLLVKGSVRGVAASTSPTPTETLVSLATESPTDMATMTNTPAPTDPPIPTATLISPYFISTVDAQVGLPSEIINPVYRIDDTHAVFSPENGWYVTSIGGSVGCPSGVNSTFHYADSSKLENELSTTWSMDRPIGQSGYYEIFYMDPQSCTDIKIKDDPTRYQVIVGKDQSISPVLNPIESDSAADANQQNADVWRSLGVFHFEDTDQISVKLDLTGLSLQSGETIAADAILIAKIPDPVSMDECKAIQNLPGKPIISADGSATSIGEPYEGNPSGLEVLESNPENCGVNARKWTLNEFLNSTPPSVTWTFNQLIPSGKYALYAWIMAETTTKMTFSYSLDGQNITSKMIDPQTDGTPGTFLKIGEITIPEGKSQKLTVKFSPDKAGIIAWDLVLVVPVQE